MNHVMEVKFIVLRLYFYEFSFLERRYNVNRTRRDAISLAPVCLSLTLHDPLCVGCVHSIFDSLRNVFGEFSNYKAC